MRAEGIAQTPMLRAGVETDAATVRDMVGSDFLFKPSKGEVFELIQVRDNTRTSLLKIPPSAPALEAVGSGEARVTSDGTSLIATVATPISGQSGKVAGLVALQAPVDLTTAMRALAPLVFEAKLVGLGAPLVIAQSEPKDATTTIELPLVLKTAKAEAVKVAIVTRAPGAASGPVKSYGLARNASWGLGGLLLVVYLVLLLKGRGQR
jgi:hypothetical protein